MVGKLHLGAESNKPSVRHVPNGRHGTTVKTVMPY
jgi:hypothetical protein